MSVKSVTMISSEFEPFYVRGGIAFATRRLVDQLTGLGIETRVLLPDWVDTGGDRDLTPLLMPMPLKMRADIRRSSRTQQYVEFCRAAVDAIERIRTTSGSDAVIAHSDEGAMFIVLRNTKRQAEPSVFWLHGLYDPPLNDFSEEQRRLLPSQSLLASAVTMADLVVTSAGILKDAQDLEWPGRLKELQKALKIASEENRVLTVESAGCLPIVPHNSEKQLSNGSQLVSLNLPSRYVLFPGRPTISKGFGIFAAIAERLRADNIACVALRPPSQAAKLESPSRSSFVHWLPWLTQEELPVVMRNSICTVLPSITEGFGLTAAESLSLGVPTLYHPIGGHHDLQGHDALPVQLTTSERAHLYRLWSELIDTYPDSWSVWTRHETVLGPLIDKWVEAVRSVIHSSTGTISRNGNGHCAQRPAEAERWGNKLRRQIEKHRLH